MLVGLQVVATVAFGMGLDKSDVGAVSQPSSLVVFARKLRILGTP